MTDLPIAEPSGPPARASIADLPGLRTLRSAAFRTALAGVLVAIGLVLLSALLLGQVDDENRQYGTDLGAFQAAAERISVGDAIYPQELLAGPVDAQGEGIYRYPPPFAQVLAPFVGLGFHGLAFAWLLFQSAAIFAAVWIGTGLGGARRDVERALWCGVAALYFLPAFDTVWKGNVSGVLALTSVLVALGGTAAGLGAATGALIKAVPGTLVPIALLIDVRARVSTLLVLGLAIGASFAISPGAWLDYPRLVLNVMAGSVDYANNLAPAHALDLAGLPDALVVLARLATLIAAAGAVVAGMVLARRPGGLRLAALLGVVALLLVPGSLWYHYLVVLLPFAAMAWPQADARSRAILFVGAALITLALAWLPLAIAGAVLMATVSGWVMRPRAPVEAVAP